MITAVDSNVLFDVLADNEFGHRGEVALAEAMSHGGLIACEVVWAELAAWFESDAKQAEFLDGIGVGYSPMESGSAYLAGRAWRSYRNSGGVRSRLIGDFLIAGHALVHADRLLTRDRGFFRKHFADLEVIEPA